MMNMNDSTYKCTTVSEADICMYFSKGYKAYAN